jgi:hypothetical protein
VIARWYRADLLFFLVIAIVLVQLFLLFALPVAAQAGFFILILAGFYSRRQLLAKAAMAASRVAA